MYFMSSICLRSYSRFSCRPNVIETLDHMALLCPTGEACLARIVARRAQQLVIHNAHRPPAAQHRRRVQRHNLTRRQHLERACFPQVTVSRSAWMHTLCALTDMHWWCPLPSICTTLLFQAAALMVPQ